MPARLELRDIRKSFDGKEIIKGVSLTVEPGEFLVLVGPSGCGKSTLLRMIAGLEEITAGELLFDDLVVNDRGPSERRVGMVFQSYALYPHMTVEQNIGFGLKLAKKPKAELSQRVEEAMRILQLTELRHHKPSQLSGGQRQRVAIGRAIVRKPNAFLFDEPLSNLDAALRVQMRMEIGRLHQRLMNTVVYVTHDQVEAMTLADRIVVLEAGRIRQIGAPLELYERPANRFVAGFIGTPTMGFLDAEVIGKEADSAIVRPLSGTEVNRGIRLPVALENGARVTLGIRPEHCRLVTADEGDAAGTVVMLERLGADTFAFVDVPGCIESMAVRIDRSATTIQPGAKVGIRLLAEHCLLFDADGEAIKPQA